MTGSARRRSRLLLRDLAGASAFGAIAISGSVPLWAVGPFAVGLALALLDRRVFATRSGLAAMLLVAAAILLFGSTLTGGLDLVVAACSFAALVAMVRMLGAPSGRTDHQVHLTSLLMVAGGAALSGDLLFGLFLVGFAVCAMVSMGIAVVDEAADPEEEVPTRPLVRRLVTGALVAAVGAAAFFVLFPRISWNLAARRSSPGLGGATTGFSDRVRLGGSGTLKTNPRIVLRATLSPDPQTEHLDAYWIGRTFDAFNGREWTGTGKPRAPAPMVTLGTSTRHVTLQRIELLPAYDARTLVALESPIMFANGLGRRESGASRSPLVEVEGEEVHFAQAAVSYEYQAYSRQLGSGSPTRLETPVDLERFRALPPDLDPRVAALAGRIAGGEADPLKAAHRMAEWLQRENRYTLELSGPVDDPLSDFLFDAKAGHCEHFATALAVLLRTRGFASRVAAGFFGGERVRDHYVVRAGDAHAWTQVYVPDRGFVSVDATPKSHRPARPDRFLAWLTQAYERVESFWRSSVVDYSFQDQVRLARQLAEPSRPPGVRRTVDVPPARAWLAAACVGLALYGAWRLRRVARERPRELPAEGLREQLERLLYRAGLRRPEEALEDVAQRLHHEGHPHAAPVEAAVRRYLAARFGGRPLTQAEARALVSTLADALRPRQHAA